MLPASQASPAAGAGLNHCSARGNIARNLVSVYRALGGGWQIRAGRDFVTEARQRQMRERTDWGDLVPATTIPDGLPEAPPTGEAQPLFTPPDW